MADEKQTALGDALTQTRLDPSRDGHDWNPDNGFMGDDLSSLGDLTQTHLDPSRDGHDWNPYHGFMMLDDPLSLDALTHTHLDPSRDGHDWSPTIWDDEDLFPLTQDWLTDVVNPPPDLQSFGGSPRDAPARQHTELLMSPLETPFPPTAAVLVPNYASGASPLSPFRPEPSSLGPSAETAYKDLLEQGYPDDSPIARERRLILHRIILYEMAQLPTSARDIKKLADIHRPTDGVPDDTLPLSREYSRAPILQCAWAGCCHSCVRPDRLKTHLFTHIWFKPFPCDKSCGDPYW